MFLIDWRRDYGTKFIDRSSTFMTVRARRIYYLSALLAFAVFGPVIILWTSGYRWIDWRRGVQLSGALYISSDPRAGVYFDDRYIGQTPQRFTHLAPGNHTVELRADGTSGWKKIIAIRPDTAVIIGPVILLPLTATQTETAIATGVTPLLNPNQRRVFGVAASNATWVVTSIWPRTNLNVIVPFQPRTISSSLDDRLFYFSDGQQALVLDQRNANYRWSFDAPTSLSWDSASGSTFFGLQKGQLRRYDVLDRTSTLLGSAGSYALSGTTVWTTRSTTVGTDILKQLTFGQTNAVLVQHLSDARSFIPGPPGILLLQNVTTHDVNEARYNPLTNQMTIVPMGPVDALWWSERSVPPIWVSGVDLYTRGDHDLPQLLDRVDHTVTSAAWTVPGHLLLTFTGQTLSINSVSTRQGRANLLAVRLATAAQLVTVETDTASAILLTEGSSPKLLTVKW